MRLHTSGLQIELRPSRASDDEGWCRVHVTAEVSGFSGEFEAWLQIEDLSRFQREVAAMYGSVGKPSIATLESAEPDIQLELAMHPLGSIAGTYSLESERRDGTATRLSGAFELDQSFLPALHESIGQLIKQLRGENVA